VGSGAESSTVIAAAETAGPRRTLIVDDDEDMLLLLRVFLGGFSDEIELIGEATDGESALEEWRTKQPDVIVMDNRMPGRTGLEVAEEILGEDEEQGIILFTAYLDADVVERANEVGVCEVVGKDRFRELPVAIRNCKP
jgi:CheY-like chemotaxis protein